LNVLFARPENTRYTSLSRKGKGGFTIVELIVSAVIILIAVFAVVAVVRKSSDMQIVDAHRRQARNIVMNIFEEDFGYLKYNDGGYTFLGAKGSVSTSSKSDSVRVFIDKSIDSGNVLVMVEPAPSNGVDAHDVTITLTWNEVGSDSSETVELTKRLVKGLFQ
jgi:Tfp pilus assembly protein PilE